MTSGEVAQYCRGKKARDRCTINTDKILEQLERASLEDQ